MKQIDELKKNDRNSKAELKLAAKKKRKITAAEQRKERKLRPIRGDESDLKYIKKKKK